MNRLFQILNLLPARLRPRAPGDGVVRAWRGLRSRRPSWWSELDMTPDDTRQLRRQADRARFKARRSQLKAMAMSKGMKTPGGAAAVRP